MTRILSQTATLSNARLSHSARSRLMLWNKPWWIAAAVSLASSSSQSQLLHSSSSSVLVQGFTTLTSTTPIRTTPTRSLWTLPRHGSLLPLDTYVPHLNPNNDHMHYKNKRVYSTSTTRLQSYNDNNNNNNDSNQSSGLFAKLKRAAKSVLPSKWFQSQQERDQALARKQAQDEITGGLRQALKDAPLPIRLMGRLVGPLLGSAMSTLQQQAQEQQALWDQVLPQATACLLADPNVQRVLGDNVILDPTPISQSRSTVSINGQTKSQLQCQVRVRGSFGTGLVLVLANSDDGLRSLQLQTSTGQVLQVPIGTARGGATISGSSGQSKFRSAHDSDDNIMDAEIIEKKKQDD